MDMLHRSHISRISGIDYHRELVVIEDDIVSSFKSWEIENRFLLMRMYREDISRTSKDISYLEWGMGRYVIYRVNERIWESSVRDEISELCDG
jgi:hypothetical protein